MKHSSRRDFLKTTSIAGLALATTSFEFKKYEPLLSFSTLGCPDWDFDTIINFAATNNYSGIEMRGIKRELDLLKCPEFSNDGNITGTLKKMQEKNLKFVDLGSSAEMHHSDETERQKNLNDAKSFIDLAQKINCPYIRVFPNNFPKDQDKNASIATISKNLHELGEYAKNTNVIVLMESHGEVIHADDILQIMHQANHPHVGIVWDIVNMWSVTKEPVTDVYKKLKKYIHHTHIKDLKVIDGKERYVFLGKGETPIFEAIDILAKNNYKGYFSFEWEKLWHPEIEEPEIALENYPIAMKEHFKLSA
jgi:sugar phosphate isomerase/epimerase